jgi:hypothetical protein
MAQDTEIMEEAWYQAATRREETGTLSISRALALGRLQRKRMPYQIWREILHLKFLGIEFSLSFRGLQKPLRPKSPE